MNKKELLETVSALSEQITKSELDEVEVETEEFRIRLSKKPHTPPPPPQMPPMSPFPAAMNGGNAPVCEYTVKSEDSGSTGSKEDKGKIIKSPIIGTFYTSAAPGKPPFVSVGSKVAKGSVVCIVESMKLMNEINSEFDGTVAEVYVSDGQAVEFDQPLFRLD